MLRFRHFISENRKELQAIQTAYGKHSLPPIKKPEEDEFSQEIEVHQGKHSLPPVHKPSPGKLTEEKDPPSPKHADMVKHYAGLRTHADKRYVQDYTQSSWKLNKNLHKAKGKVPKMHAEHVAHLDSALHHFKTPKAMTVHSAVHTDVSKLKKGKDGHIAVRHHGYMSTSINHNISESFGKVFYHGKDRDPDFKEVKHVLKIHVPKGHPGAYVDHVSHNSGEKEFILPRGSKLKIHPKPVVKRLYAGSSEHTYTWHAKVVK